MVTIGYTSYNRLIFTVRTLPVLFDWLDRTKADAQIVVVDDHSADDSPEWLEKFFRDRRVGPPHELILRESRCGNAVCSNIAWRYTDGDYVKLDNDVQILRDDWLDILTRYARVLPQIGVIAHNCEGGQYYPPGGFPESELDGIRVAMSGRNPYNTVAGACVLIPAGTLKRCGRWNEREAYQTLNRGLDLTYSAKVHFAGLLSVYSTGVRDIYVKCLRGKSESDQYVAERQQMKRLFWKWALPVIEAYRSGLRELDDVK